MTTADGQRQIAFTEWIEECTAGRRSKRACRCSECAAPIASRASSGRNRRTVGPRRTVRLRYGIGLLVAVATGAGVIGQYTGVASAEPAPSHSGWDGSVYWFRNSVGDWRWTSHEDIYLNRIGSGGGSTATGGSSNVGPGASTGSTGDTEAAVEFALAQLGKPFVTAGNGPDGYDCSGLVQQAYQRAGISLPRVANDQYGATTPISADQLQRGDLLFWSDSDSAEGIHHVGIYLGDNQYVEAAHPGTNVRISTLSSSYYPTHMGRP